MDTSVASATSVHTSQACVMVCCATPVSGQKCSTIVCDFNLETHATGHEGWDCEELRCATAHSSIGHANGQHDWPGRSPVREALTADLT